MSQPKCAVVDSHGLYLGMFADDFPIAEGHRRLPTITECDLAPGQYRWIADEQNPFGGAFWPLTPKGVVKRRIV